MTQDQKEQGGCCGGKKPEQIAQIKKPEKDCHDQKDKKPQTVEPEAKGSCCGGEKK